MNAMTEILNQFCFSGQLIDCHAFGSGYINNTYIAVYRMDDGSFTKYVVQKINEKVFKNIDGLMNNIFTVTSYLHKQICLAGGDPNRETLHFIKTKDNKKYYQDKKGRCYRAYIFVKDTVSFDSVDSSELFRKLGWAFGRFQRYLANFPADSLYETIPHFHNTAWRYQNEFLSAVDNDLMSRKSRCQNEIEFVRARRKDCSIFVDLIEQGRLPLRVTHNDTKLNNVIFDRNSREAVCVIDLDTVMPGSALFDFGDAIRYGANTAAEDEQNLEKVSLNLEYFKAFAKGFLQEAGDMLCACELNHLAYASKLMTLECGMRFLTDYLNGDTYFKTAYPEHNLVRAKNQLKLVVDMESKMSEMERIIKNLIIE